MRYSCSMSRRKAHQDLASLLQHERVARGLSLRQAGALAGVSGECWRQWELGHVPKINQLAKLSDSLEIPIIDLFSVIRS